MDLKLIEFEPRASGTSLLTMIRVYQQAQFFYQAFSTGIFEALEEEPQKLNILAEKTGYLKDRLIFLLDALTSVDLVQKKGDCYCNSSISTTYLRAQSNFYLGDLINMEFSCDQSWNWEGLASWLKGDSTKNGGHDPVAVFQPAFVRAMAQGVLSNNSVLETVLSISTHPCFKTAKRLLDLGGGHGLFSIALKRINPQLKTTVFDLPQVEQVTQEYAAVYGTELSFHPGDFYEAELPPHQDIVLAFDILHPVSPSKKEAVFQKVYKALNSGGCLFYKLWFLDNSHTQPSRAALFALKCKLTNQYSHVYTQEEAEEMLQRVGFKLEGVLPIGDNASKILICMK